MLFTASSVRQFLDLNATIEKNIERVAQRLEDLQKQMPEIRQSRINIHLIPSELAQWIPSHCNWLYYWLSPAYRYRYHFPQTYGGLIAQQQALYKIKPREAQPNFEFSQDEDLKKCRALETKLNTAEEALQRELQLEKFRLFKSSKKVALIKTYLKSLEDSQLKILSIKLNILKEHSERIKTFVCFPKLEPLNESISAPYRQESFKDQLLRFYKEIKASLQRLEHHPKLSSLKPLFHEIAFILAQFYYAPPEEHESDTISLDELESLLKKGLMGLLEMDFNTLQALLERSCQAFSQHITHLNPLYQRACEKLLYAFMLHYLNFIDQNPFPKPGLDNKLKRIERCLIHMELKTPLQSGYIQEIIQLKNNPQTKYPQKKIQIQCTIIMEILNTQLSVLSKPKMRMPQPPQSLEIQANKDKEPTHSTPPLHPPRGILR